MVSIGTGHGCPDSREGSYSIRIFRPTASIASVRICGIDKALPPIVYAPLAFSYLLFHVGDGVIGYRKSGKLLVASAPQNGEFANTTTFVTSPDALMHSRALRGVQPRIEGFFLMSDGCEAALYHKGKRKLAPLISKPFLRLQLLSSGTSQEMLEAVMERIIAKRTQDDCSMALLVKNAGRSGMWSRMTPRDRASILGIATGNRNRRRRAIRQYAKAYGAEAVRQNEKGKETA